MNKIRIIASLIVVCVFAGIALFAFRSREPVYQERPLSAWLEDLDYGQPSFRREAVPQAEEAVRQIGTNAVPFLVGMMRCKDSPFRKKMVALCSKQSFIKFNFRPPADTLQWRGALGIYVLGPAGKAAIPELINLLRPRTVHHLLGTVFGAAGLLAHTLFLIAQQRVDFHVVDTVKGKHRHPLRPVL